MRIKQTITLIIFAILLLTSTTMLLSCNKTGDYHIEQYSTTVTIGIDAPFAIIHTSDTHFALAYDYESKELQDKAISRTKRFGNRQDTNAEEVSILSKENGYTIINTGDFMDFVSDANLDKLREYCANNDVIFTPGNHDTGANTQEDIQKLSDVTNQNADFSSTIKNGLNFVAINNSNHKMTPEHLAFLKQQVAKGLPIVLLVHVPLYEKSLYDISIDDDGSAYLMNVPENLMTSYSKSHYQSQKADEITQKAYDYICSEPLFKTILAGHLHLEKLYMSKVANRIPQYVIGLDSMNIITFC